MLIRGVVDDQVKDSLHPAFVTALDLSKRRLARLEEKGGETCDVFGILDCSVGLVHLRVVRNVVAKVCLRTGDRKSVV